jgi:hypothetical protein
MQSTLHVRIDRWKTLGSSLSKHRLITLDEDSKGKAMMIRALVVKLGALLNRQHTTR